MRTHSKILSGVMLAAVGSGIAFVACQPEPPGLGGVTGRYFAVDDTGFRDRPLGKGTFLVIPGVTVHDVWPDDVEPDAGPVYRDIFPTVDLDALANEYGAALVTVQPDGRFRINTPTGPTVVCLVGIKSVNGCVEIDLPERGSLRASYGEVGFSIRVD